MTLRETLQRVLDFNESVQMRILDHEISRKTYEAEKGIYEPAVVGSVDHVDSRRENNAQAQQSLQSSLFSERNTLYNGGLEFLAPSGAKLRTGVTLRDLQNNLQQQRSILVGGANVVDREYEWFVGTSVTQPLLKGFGPRATNVRIRLAALASDLAFQEYRRQLMLTVARTEAAYWDLYLTQEQERLTRESLTVASTILTDNRNRVSLGRSSELEVLQSQAGVALRESRLSDARMKRLQGVSQLTTLFSEPGIQTNFLVQASDQPSIQPHSLSYYDSYEQAFNLNPDYLSRRKQIQQENIRVAYAKNQRLPQLDLKASYGLNGLGTSPGEAWEDVSHSDFPAWSIGLEMRIPVTGGIRERNELAAARLAKQRALLGLKEIEVQIANALDSALTKVRSLQDNVQSYQSVVDFHQQLLKSQLERLEVGRSDSRAVLETEEKLFEAKLAVIDSLVQYQKSLVELELVSGATLQTHNLDLTKAQLENRTTALFQERKWPPSVLEKYAREAEKADPFGNMGPANLDQRRALERLREEMTPRTYPPLTPEEQQRAIQALRREMPPRAYPSLTPEEQQKALEMLRQKMKENP